MASSVTGCPRKPLAEEKSSDARLSAHGMELAPVKRKRAVELRPGGELIARIVSSLVTKLKRVSLPASTCFPAFLGLLGASRVSSQRLLGATVFFSCAPLGSAVGSRLLIASQLCL